MVLFSLQGQCHVSLCALRKDATPTTTALKAEVGVATCSQAPPPAASSSCPLQGQLSSCCVCGSELISACEFKTVIVTSCSLVNNFL